MGRGCSVAGGSWVVLLSNAKWGVVLAERVIVCRRSLSCAGGVSVRERLRGRGYSAAGRSRFVVRCLARGVGLAVWLAGAGPALGSGWIPQAAPAPVVAYGSLSAVSCTSRSACTAVG